MGLKVTTNMDQVGSEDCESVSFVTLILRHYVFYWKLRPKIVSGGSCTPYFIALNRSGFPPAIFNSIYIWTRYFQYRRDISYPEYSIIQGKKNPTVVCSQISHSVM